MARACAACACGLDRVDVWVMRVPVPASVQAHDLRLRIEHAQIIHPDDIARIAQLGILPSMQPIHATSDMRYAEARLGEARIAGAYAWKSLLAAGVQVRVRFTPLVASAPTAHQPCLLSMI